MSSYAHWHVGMEVECIDAGVSGVSEFVLENWPLRNGAVYTISEIRRENSTYRNGRPIGAAVVVELAGVSNPSSGAKGFFIERFRPVQKRKTDISIFQRLLTHPRVTIGEDA